MMEVVYKIKIHIFLFVNSTVFDTFTSGTCPKCAAKRLSRQMRGRRRGLWWGPPEGLCCRRSRTAGCSARLRPSVLLPRRLLFSELRVQTANPFQIREGQGESVAKNMVCLRQTRSRDMSERRDSKLSILSCQPEQPLLSAIQHR